MSDAATYKTRKQGTAKPLWSDGLHFVRAAGPRDRHPMRFVVGAHKTTASTHKRHAPTEEEAIERAKAATSFWLAAHPADRIHLTVAPADEATEALPSDSVVLQHFATTRFNCVYANPVAQVWRCTREPGEFKPVGRPKKGAAGGRGAAPTQDALPHHVGDCVVTKDDEPIRNNDGTVKVFGEIAAEEFADDLYAQEPEENTISWKRGNTKVGATPNCEILFDPESQSSRKPFAIWLPGYSKFVFEDITHATHSRDAIPLSKLPKHLRFDAEEARARARSEDRQPSFIEKPLRFRSLAGAYAEAERREKMLRGEVVR